jgi:hypothetical protein
LIFEDDVDWDVRLRPNLQRFALASRFLAENKEVLSSSPKYKIEHRPNTETPKTSFHMLSENGITETLPTLPLSSVYTKAHDFPKNHGSGLTSPYGNPAEWDVLWIGACGAGFPRYSANHKHKSDVTTSNVILTLPNDSTVPMPKYLKAHPFQDALDPLASAYPPHTRIYHRASGGELCTIAYAVSQRGARRLLHQFGLKKWDTIFDSALGQWCAGQDEKPKPGSANGGKSDDQQHPLVGVSKEKSEKVMDRVCLTSQPPIFAHHHPKSGESDIGGLGGGYARKYETKYLRYSVRMNLETIVQGEEGAPLKDQWPDTPDE